MKIANITVENWLRYRGVHTRDLDADVYAVVARHVADEERSNWLGKTSFLYAAPFALFGCKPPGVRLEDDWITHGEGKGGVVVELDDGTRVIRGRKRGKSTQLIVKHGNQVAKGDEAQKLVEQLVGVGEDDFFATCFFKQKEMARIVNEPPRDRMQRIGGWFRLGPLQSCEQNVRDRLNALVEQKQKIVARTAVILELIGESDEKPDLGGLKKEADAKHNAATKLQSEIDEHADWVVSAQHAAEYEKLRVRGIELRNELRELDPQAVEKRAEFLKKAAAKSQADLDIVVKEEGEAEKLSRGEFDGHCPVMNDECPVASQVRLKMKGNNMLVEKARKKASDLRHKTKTQRGTLADEQAKLDKARKLVAEFEQTKVRALDLKRDWQEIQESGPPPDTSELGAKVERAWTEANDAQLAYQNAKTIVDNAKQHAEEIERLKQESTKLNEKIAVHREALVIFGRNGAQRQIAEVALAEIEVDANALLIDAGIDLQVETQWSREAASGLATACDSCGAPFPKSQKVKQCERCGAGRGPKTIDKLDIEISDRSGAAEDLAGISLQLAAAAWLRRERNVGWSVAFIDEPFGSLDAANRRALSTHFAAMLKGRYGFAQSFVVAHDQSITDALPARVEIVADDRGSALT